MNFNEIYFDNCHKNLQKIYNMIGDVLNNYKKNKTEDNKKEIELIYDTIISGKIDQESDSECDNNSVDSTNFLDIINDDNNNNNIDIFYDNFINNNINNNMIDIYKNKNYIKLYNNYKNNFIF